MTADESDGHPRSPAPLLAVPVPVKGTFVTFTVRDDPDRRAYFCLGVRKSGSTFLNHIMNYLARLNGYNSVDIAGTFFRNGFVVNDWANSDLDQLLHGGNLYGGFRAFPTALGRSEVFQTSSKVFMFRDPRDALVSQYFSDAYSHHIPSEKVSRGGGRELFLQKRAEALSANINDYVLKHARNFNRVLEQYVTLLDDRACLVLRYEEFVFQKRALVEKVLDRFNWSCSGIQLDRIISQVDKFPSLEDKTSFIRKVSPGDHREKLTADTINTLNTILAGVLSRYNYAS